MNGHKITDPLRERARFYNHINGNRDDVKMLRLALAVFAAVLFIIAPAYAGGDNDILYQVSTISALEEGGFDGLEYISELMKHGGFGIGTFDKLDGEMVVLDGKCYQVKSDGKVIEADSNMTTPFADVTFFAPDLAGKLEGPADLEMLEAFLEEMLPDDGLIYAVKVTGRFGFVKTRSVNAQKKPYPKLAGALKGQAEFMQRTLDGTLVGLRMPKYMVGGLNVPGYHFHFISKDLDFGGHVLDCGIMAAEVEADATDQLFVALPEGGWSTPKQVRNELFEQLDRDLERLEAEEKNAE